MAKRVETDTSEEVVQITRNATRALAMQPFSNTAPPDDTGPIG